MSQSLSEAQNESVSKRMEGAKLQRDFEDAVATLDRIPPEVLKAYTHPAAKEKVETL